MPRPSRVIFLAKVALGHPIVRDARRFLVVFVLTVMAGYGAALVLLAPTRGDPGPLGPLASGIIVAALAAATLAVRAGRAVRREQAAEFTRMARRLGEEKTGRSDLGSSLRRLASAVERAVPEIFGQDDAVSEPVGVWGGSGGSAPDPRSPEARIGIAAPTSEGDPWRARRLLRIARAAALFGGTDLELKPVAFAGPCAEVIEEYRRLAGPDCEIIYIEDGGGNWLTAPINRPLFVLALRELIENVLAHGGAWGRISVTTEPVEDAIVLRVRDDGRGIAPEVLHEILSGQASGLRAGLGIPLARAIVEAHGGTFRLESEQGHGTTATLRFPTHR